MVFGLFSSGVKQIDAIFFPLSQELFHPGANVYLSAEVGVGKRSSLSLSISILPSSWKSGVPVKSSDYCVE